MINFWISANHDSNKSTQRITTQLVAVAMLIDGMACEKMKRWEWMKWLPGVPGRFLLFLGLEVGLGLGFGSKWIWSWEKVKAAEGFGTENTSPDIIWRSGFGFLHTKREGNKQEEVQENKLMKLGVSIYLQIQTDEGLVLFKLYISS